MNFKFDSESKAEQIKKQINDNSPTNNEGNIVSILNETKDDIEKDFLLPEDNLDATVEETGEEQKAIEDVKMKVEDIKPLKKLKTIIPFSNSHLIKDVARNPYLARPILYLEEHGCSNFLEMSEALGLSYGNLWFTFNKLKKVDFPVVKVNKHEQLNKLNTYYELRQTGDNEQLKKMLKELRVWYEYYSLKAFMKALPEFEWVELEKLESNYDFRTVIKRYGFDFEEAIVLLLRNGVIRVKGEGENFTHIKRVFDNYGARISEFEPRDLIGNRYE